MVFVRDWNPIELNFVQSRQRGCHIIVLKWKIFTCWHIYANCKHSFVYNMKKSKYWKVLRNVLAHTVLNISSTSWYLWVGGISKLTSFIDSLWWTAISWKQCTKASIVTFSHEDNFVRVLLFSFSQKQPSEAVTMSYSNTA